MPPVRPWRPVREARRGTRRSRRLRREKKKDLNSLWIPVGWRVACLLSSSGKREAARNGVRKVALDPALALARRVGLRSSRYDVRVDTSRGVGTPQSGLRVPARARDMCSEVGGCSSTAGAGVVGARTCPYRVCTSCHLWCDLGRVCLVWGDGLIVQDGMRMR